MMKIGRRNHGRCKKRKIRDRSLVVNGRNLVLLRFHALPFPIKGERSLSFLPLRILQTRLVLPLPWRRPINSNASNELHDFIQNQTVASFDFQISEFRILLFV
ncbi:hypothetical protein ACSQ67_005667 [Phaseolus vulgaris]